MCTKNYSIFSFNFLILMTLLRRLEAEEHVQVVESCTMHHIGYFLSHDTSICYKNQQFYLAHVNEWRFAADQILAKNFPVDKESRNYVREVKNALFSVVYPTPLWRRPQLVALAEDVLTDVLDLKVPTSSSMEAELLQFVNGDTLRPDAIPLAHRYGGHQFGYWSGQLGDGRAVMLGEFVNHRGERWELQLKGSGLTPYSRRGDGKAVIRSSVREFLCSEAMSALGIGSSRAASLVISDDPVTRDQFYNGNIKSERAAVVLRVAQSWFRIGSLEILTKNYEIELLRSLVDFIITNYFPGVNSSDPDRVLAFYQTVVKETARLVAQWQSVGFTHGVCNTDNFSILSITIDYGPFGFMESYDPNFVPNTSDDEGHYSYTNQPDVARFNLNKLKDTLSPLLNRKQQREASTILKGYAIEYKSNFMELFMRKLGFSSPRNSYTEDDEQFIAILLKIMEDTKADFTMTFRELSEATLDELDQIVAGESVDTGTYWTLPILANHDWFEKWWHVYKQLLHDSRITDLHRRATMLKTNPRYILRNWIAQSVIEHIENNDFTEIKTVLEILKNPYTYSSKAEERRFASSPPEWSRALKVSCSS